MTERERLIGLIKHKQDYGVVLKENQMDDRYNYTTEVDNPSLADYLLSNGVIVPPVKVGDTVYIKGEAVKISYIHIEEEVTYCIQLDCGGRDCCCCPFYEDSVSWEGEHDCSRYGYIEFTVNDIGKTVFLTREEAENDLAEGDNTQ